ncbi:MAG TPA: phosphoenolpyruvate synthase [Patescibacteria group bacterium]|nr:phosphoenolpyruvate synthase [Patescibacteria group bacterium]
MTNSHTTPPSHGSFSTDQLKFSASFSDFRRNNISQVGGKIANLGELAAAGVPGSPGFAVMVNAWHHFLSTVPQVKSLIERHIEEMNVEDDQDVAWRMSEVRHAISTAVMPDQIVEDIHSAYHNILGHGTVCAVRSSATAEDLPDASFAGQQDTYLGVQGEADLVAAILACWSSIFTDRAVIYRAKNSIPHLDVGIAVGVQKMVASTRSGVIFTINPVTNDHDVMVIEVIYGLGEAFVSGHSNADTYWISKDSWEIIKRRHTSQDKMVVLSPDGKGTVERDVEDFKRDAYKLTDEQARDIARRAKVIEDHYGSPQDIEFGIDPEDNFVTLQARPITTSKIQIDDEEPPHVTALVLSDDGLGASPGVAYGPIRIINDFSECDLVQEGDILVTTMTTPDFLPAIRRAAAIITAIGGMNCHATIVGREQQIPVVVSVKDATTRFANGQMVTVDGSHGIVYEGKADEALAWAQRRRDRLAALQEKMRNVKTRTKIGVILGDAMQVAQLAGVNADGANLVRAEVGNANIGVHPLLCLEQGRGEWYTQQLVNNIVPFANAFIDQYKADPKQGYVFYRTNDFKTNEYSNIEGADKFEPSEENPMLGERGALKYLLHPEAFAMECEALRRVIFDMGYSNIIVMLPFVRTPEELGEVLALAESYGLPREKVKFVMMAEIPSNILELRAFAALGIFGISFGTNDLTQLVYGADRDGGHNTKRYTARGESVQIMLRMGLTLAKELGLYVGLCGQMVSDFPDTAEMLVSLGIDSIGVDIDKVDTTRHIVVEAERKLGITAIAA